MAGPRIQDLRHVYSAYLKLNGGARRFSAGKLVTCGEQADYSGSISTEGAMKFAAWKCDDSGPVPWTRLPARLFCAHQGLNMTLWAIQSCACGFAGVPPMKVASTGNWEASKIPYSATLPFCHRRPWNGWAAAWAWFTRPKTPSWAGRLR
jgi:hypothetical protein